MLIRFRATSLYAGRLPAVTEVLQPETLDLCKLIFSHFKQVNVADGWDSGHLSRDGDVDPVLW